MLLVQVVVMVVVACWHGAGADGNTRLKPWSVHVREAAMTNDGHVHGFMAAHRGLPLPSSAAVAMVPGPGQSHFMMIAASSCTGSSFVNKAVRQMVAAHYQHGPHDQHDQHGTRFVLLNGTHKEFLRPTYGACMLKGKHSLLVLQGGGGGGIGLN